jgi:hypothetical protein
MGHQAADLSQPTNEQITQPMERISEGHDSEANMVGQIEKHSHDVAAFVRAKNKNADRSRAKLSQLFAHNPCRNLSLWIPNEIEARGMMLPDFMSRAISGQR